MKTRTLIVQLLVLSQLQLLFGLFDNDERIKPQTFGTTTGIKTIIFLNLG